MPINWSKFRKNKLGYSGNETANNLRKMKENREAAWTKEQEAAASAPVAPAAPQTVKKCGKKPMAWIGTQRNPAFKNWEECIKSGGNATGGKRKTQRRKSQRRKTHKRR